MEINEKNIPKNKVSRAIIMAAGFGNRMRPLTLSIPKPMVKVNGIRMIDSIIEALHANEIYEIYIVVGYLKEKFIDLKNKYKDISFINNSYFDTCNNISSLYVARDYLENAIVLDGDQLINNKEVLNPYFDKSGYNCVWVDNGTDEWLLDVEEGIVKSCSRTGGKCGWQLYSISRWTSDDGRKLKKHIEKEFEVNKNTDIYWDDVAMFCYPNEYKLGIWKMNKNDVIEIDNISELIELDSSYSDLVRGE